MSGSGDHREACACRNHTPYSYGAALHDHHVQYSSQVRVRASTGLHTMTAIDTVVGVIYSTAAVPGGASVDLKLCCNRYSTKRHSCSSSRYSNKCACQASATMALPWVCRSTCNSPTMPVNFPSIYPLLYPFPTLVTTSDFLPIL